MPVYKRVLAQADKLHNSWIPQTPCMLVMGFTIVSRAESWGGRVHGTAPSLASVTGSFIVLSEDQLALRVLFPPKINYSHSTPSMNFPVHNQSLRLRLKAGRRCQRWNQIKQFHSHQSNRNCKGRHHGNAHCI